MRSNSCTIQKGGLGLETILAEVEKVAAYNGLQKKEALRLSVAAAMPTVFTSGVILTLCGFVISFIASQNSIAAVGSLLGRGTLVSVLMITVVLPSVLYLLDAFVMKLTVKKK